MVNSRALLEKLEKVRLFAMDVDGVLTDGQIYLSEQGEEFKAFFARDGMGLKCYHLAGGISAWITARDSPVVKRRAGELGVADVVLDSKDKGAAITSVCEKHQVRPEQVAFLGDDLQDLPAMARSGVAITVPGCPPELRERADFVTEFPGGRGAVREVVERILKAQNRWDDVVSRFLS